MRGVLFTIFAVACLAAGFIVFPAVVLKTAWNYFEFLPVISIYQGVLLWAIVAIALYMANNNVVSMRSGSRITDDELKQMIENIKIQNKK